MPQVYVFLKVVFNIPSISPHPFLPFLFFVAFFLFAYYLFLFLYSFLLPLFFYFFYSFLFPLFLLIFHLIISPSSFSVFLLHQISSFIFSLCFFSYLVLSLYFVLFLYLSFFSYLSIYLSIYLSSKTFLSFDSLNFCHILSLSFSILFIHLFFPFDHIFNPLLHSLSCNLLLSLSFLFLSIAELLLCSNFCHSLSYPSFYSSFLSPHIVSFHHKWLSQCFFS
ncbi:unnamed protein product [Acanthosepion pharaonis]|uniref:Uncharacterized protein n=1 Tax=Acanthosepion pharaonis TaxID=158019 RepID=A0A812C559_ACAPH|nr:unnamed protein product [Sepia pharaonis]